METKKLIQKIKASHLPCYLSDNDSIPTPLDTDSITFHEFKQLSYCNFQLESSSSLQADVSPSLQVAECASFSKVPETSSLGLLDRRTLTSRLGRAIRGYLQGDTLNQTVRRRKVKCVSMERTMPEDLCMAYRYKASAKQTKKTCDMNLWLLLEKIKERFRAYKKDSIQTLFEDLSRLIVNFILSSESTLHFNKCKYILDKLEELENIIHDRFHLKSSSISSVTLSPIPSLKVLQSTQSTEEIVVPSKATSEVQKLSPLSLKGNPPGAAFTYSSIPKTPTMRSDGSLGDTEEKTAYKEVLNLIAQAKYTMAQMGHLLHYDRLANPHIEQLYPKEFKKIWQSTHLATPTGCRIRGKQSESQFTTFSTALDVNLTSIDLDAEKPQTSQMEMNTTEDLSVCSNLMRYFYCSQTFLEDFEENIVSKRKESLGKYCQWKMKKWASKYKKIREKVTQKYQEKEIACKICAQKVKINKLKEHSEICRKMAELNKELKDLEIKLGDILSDTFMRSKELHTQLLVMKNEYQRLKKRKLGRPSLNSICSQGSITMRQSQKNMSTASGGSADDNNALLLALEARVNSEKLKGSKTERDSNEELSDDENTGLRKLTRTITNVDNRRNINVEINCREENHVKKDPTLRVNQKEKVEECMSPEELLINPEGKKKSFVERLLDKCPQMYEGSPSIEGDNSPKICNHPTKTVQSLSQRTKLAQLITNTKDSGFSRFFADRLRTESASEEEVESDRNETDEDKAKRGYDNSNQEPLSSSEWSEALKLSAEMSSSDKSLCNSPGIGRAKSITVYKKSKFYNGNELGFEGIDNFKEKEKKEEDEEQEKKEITVTPFEAEDEGEDERVKRRRATMFTQKTQGKEDVMLLKVDRRPSQELNGLKAKIDNKKNANNLYEVIKAKGKIMLNQEPYQKKMEMVKDDAFREVQMLKAKIEDQDIKAFADNFLMTLEKRIYVGKVLEETQRSSDLLEGKSGDESVDKKALQRKFSLLRGNSSLTLTKKKLGFASTPTTLQPSNGLEDQLSPFRSPNRQLKAQSSHSHRKMFEFIKYPEDSENNTTRSTKCHSTQNSLHTCSLGKTGEPASHTQIAEKLKKLKEAQQKSLPELQEEGDETPQIARQVTESIFGTNNFEHSFNDEEPKKLDDNKTQDKALFSLDELMASSPKNQTNGPLEPQVGSRATQISLGGDENALIDTVPKDPEPFKNRNIIGLRLHIGANCNDNGNREEDRKSPETPSFEAPLLWRTSTAPARTLTGIKKQLMNNRSAKNDLLDFIKNSKKEDNTDSKESEGPTIANDVDAPSISSTSIIDGGEPPEIRLHVNKRITSNEHMATYEEEPDQESDDSKGAHPAAKPCRILLDRQRSFNCPAVLGEIPKMDLSSDEEMSPGKQLNKMLNETGSRIFAEDLTDDKNKEESPVVLESPMIQKGYYSDSHAKKMPRTLIRQPLIGINDFELIKMISKGAYGRVWLVRRKATNDIYAMKEINLAERTMKNNKELESLRKENKIFGLAKEDFVVRALFTFIHETYICFVMEYMIGGDFGDILYNYCALEEDVARFYIAEIILALEYLHSLGIVHRDLKPDNILLDKSGHAKLTDFGLSETGLSKKMAAGPFNEESPSLYQKKEQTISKLCRIKSDLDRSINLKLKGKVMERRANSRNDESVEENTEKKDKDSREEQHHQKLKKVHRLIGTPDYMAPEIILGQSITNYSIDWWSLGVILFEFLCGTPPFNDESPDKIYDNIVKLRVPWDQITIGYGEDCLSPEAADLIKKLLVLDHTKRLGSNSVDEIKQHPFFKGIDWKKLRTQQAPIIPEPKSDMDTSNFVRLGDQLKKKDHENPFMFVPKDKNSVSNRQVAKEMLEAASENFSIFNYAALDSDNKRVADEAMKQKEEELKRLVGEEHEEINRKGIYDDIFDMPN